MTISLHDATARTFLQLLTGLSGVMAKGAAAGIDLAEVVEARLAPDMLPFSYQVQASCGHSRGALEAARSGVFSPPKPSPATYAELQALVAETMEAVKGFTPEEVDGFVGGHVDFHLGERVLPFSAEDFLLSFSLPNFNFHATTAYDILRWKGVPLTKGDFLGRLRLKRP